MVGPPSPGAAPCERLTRERTAARVVLLDPTDRILLLHGFEPTSPTTTWWFTPGGGVEPGESLEQAACREVAEETGIDDFHLGPVVWRRRSAFSFAGRRWINDEWYHLGRTEIITFDTSGQTELERATTMGLRWWTLDELRETKETVYPLGLGELLDGLLVNGPPTHPLRLDSQNE